MSRAVRSWVVNAFAWVCLLAVSFYGNIKLGTDHVEPDNSYPAWFALLFPTPRDRSAVLRHCRTAMHFADPPVGEDHTIAVAREAMTIRRA